MKMASYIEIKAKDYYTIGEGFVNVDHYPHFSVGDSFEDMFTPLDDGPYFNFPFDFTAM